MRKSVEKLRFDDRPAAEGISRPPDSKLRVKRGVVDLCNGIMDLEV